MRQRKMPNTVSVPHLAINLETGLFSMRKSRVALNTAGTLRRMRQLAHPLSDSLCRARSGSLQDKH